MSARRSARISKIPRISYHEAQADTSDLASDAEEDEDSYVDSSSLSQVTKVRDAFSKSKYLALTPTSFRPKTLQSLTVHFI